MKSLTYVGVFLLIFLVSTALVAASPSVYFVEDIRYESADPGSDIQLILFGGIYEEKSDPRLHYKKIGVPYRWFGHCFLYRDPNHWNIWTLGLGNFSTVQPKLRAPARKPPFTQWKDVKWEETWDFKDVLSLSL